MSGVGDKIPPAKTAGGMRIDQREHVYRDNAAPVPQANLGEAMAHKIEMETTEPKASGDTKMPKGSPKKEPFYDKHGHAPAQRGPINQPKQGY